MLARPAMLAQLGSIAASHHERIDGSGYHRALGAASIPVPARLIATADAYHAMTEPRAYRPAMPPDEAAKELRGEVTAGHLDADAVDAVLAAGGPQTTENVTAGRPGSHHAKSKCSHSSLAAHPTAKSRTP